MKNPYAKLPDYCFWPRVMANSTSWMLNPVTSSKKIGKNEKVSTMGSCFAQHMSKYISNIGLNYYVAEKAPPSMDPLEAKNLNYGIFSARYGNVYTVRQALQLLHRSTGKFIPKDSIWKKGSKFIDPFRPQIQPNGFSSESELDESRKSHLSSVKDIFLTSDWIVFTLGLTEAWRSKVDGAVFPLAPGVSGGSFDQDSHEFINFNINEVKEDLFNLIKETKELNPNIKFLLTLSPVPLNATYENKHIVVSTTYSKSVLRVAIAEAENTFENVFYFPSYEIFTSSSTRGAYFGPDHREVLDLGVKHAMRLFGENFISKEDSQSLSNSDLNLPKRTIGLNSDIVCDEEAITILE